MKNVFHQFIPKERRREIELLLLCARPRPDTATLQDITSLANKGVDWKYLIETARSHKLQYLLYRSLKDTCPESAPSEDLKKLELEYRANATDSLFIFGKLLSILKLLRKNNILAIPFKGPVLAEMVYGDYALRQFGDLDILIDRENVLRAIKIFGDHGFKPELDLNQKQFVAYAAQKSSIALISSISGLNVDLHWEMSGSYTFYPFLLNSIKSHLIHEDIGGKHVRQPCKEDLVVYLCLNGSRDCWEDMESLSSLAGLVQSNRELDWKRIEELAKRMRCERIFHLGLFMVCDLFDVELPEDVMQLVKNNPELPGLASTVYNTFFKENNGSSEFEVNSKFSMFHFRVRDRWSEKFRYGKYIIFGATAREWTRVPMPAKLSFVYGILRPVRLFVAFLINRLRAERRQPATLTADKKSGVRIKKIMATDPHRLTQTSSLADLANEEGAIALR